MFERPDRQHVIVMVVFSGNLPDTDVDRAASELERSGYRVTRLPDRLRARLGWRGRRWRQCRHSLHEAEQARSVCAAAVVEIVGPPLPRGSLVPLYVGFSAAPNQPLARLAKMALKALARYDPGPYNASEGSKPAA